MKHYHAVILVSPMGHDVNRIAPIFKRWMEETGLFTVELAGICQGAVCSIEEYMADEKRIFVTDLFVFLCSDECWQKKETEKSLADAIAGGKGVLFNHGLHPGFRNNPEIEKMIGLLWRETASHGDFNHCDVTITDRQHPITAGVADFHTQEEVFCQLENPWKVPLKVLATAYSDPQVVSRWGYPGTGQHEPVLTAGQYGRGRTVDFLLGHVWPYYTGHGLMENTLAALEPPEFKTLFLRSCEWAAGDDF